MNIGIEHWSCKRCEYRVMTKDQNGKPFKKVPASCPSCGHRCSSDCEHAPGARGPSRQDPKRS